MNLASLLRMATQGFARMERGYLSSGKGASSGTLREPAAKDCDLPSTSIQTNEELFYCRQLLAVTNDRLCFVDAQGYYTAVNPAYAAMFNVSPDDLCGKSMRDVVGEANFSFIGPRLALAMAGEVQIFTAEPKLASGEYLLFEAEYRPHSLNGSVIGVAARIRDVTALTASQHALASSEERLRLTMEATNDGLWDWNIRDDNIYTTGRFETLMGPVPDGSSRSLATLKQSVHPEDLSAVLATLQAHLAGLTEHCQAEFRRTKASGRTHWMSVRGRVVERDAAGTALRMVGTLSDITRRKACEAQLREQRDELTQHNAELERFNRASVGRELDMMALKGQVNALMSELGRAPPYTLSPDSQPALPAPETAQ